ncbi:MAG: AzlD domain-containing protein [Deferrisomatales bacterium]|nr:AzlD domain-containing protein [Deferrisomatales bacterium]
MSADLKIWAIIGCAAAGTFLLRLSFFALFGNRGVPATLERPLKYIPPAVLAALVVPALVMHQGAARISWHNPRLLAGLVAALATWKTGSVLWTLGAGMVGFWVFRAVLG